MPQPTRHSPITVALVDDYDVVVLGVAHMLDPYQDRVRIVELDTNEPVADIVDIVPYDSIAQPESDHDEIAVLINNPRARRVVVYTRNFHPDLINSGADWESTVTCRKHSPPATSSPHWKRSTPATSS